MDQLMKAVEKATQRKTYDRMNGRVLSPQMGWLQGFSVAHVGIQLETLIQASVRLKEPHVGAVHGLRHGTIISEPEP